MVKGLEAFKRAFADHADQYLLIGGTASSVVMESAGLPFRSTKDLDIVLHVEVLDASFGERFWQFVQEGEYEIRAQSTNDRRHFYRFQKPAKSDYPAMIELFARAPDRMRPLAPGPLTPIPFEDDVSSLSAILLDDDYYQFLLAGRDEIEGLPLVRQDRLIPLKALAWMELRERKARGEQIDSKNIRKHLNDVLRLSQLLAPDNSIVLPEKIRQDMVRFLAEAKSEPDLDPQQLGMGNISAETIWARVAEAYGIQ